MRAVEVVMSTDYTTGKDAYVRSICEISTPEGCDISSNLYGEMLFPSIESSKGRTDCRAVSARQVSEIPFDGYFLPVYRIEAELINLNTQQVHSGPIYAVMAQENSGEWKLYRILFEDELNQIRQEEKSQ